MSRIRILILLLTFLLCGCTTQSQYKPYAIPMDPGEFHFQIPLEFKGRRMSGTRELLATLHCREHGRLDVESRAAPELKDKDLEKGIREQVYPEQEFEQIETVVLTDGSSALRANYTNATEVCEAIYFVKGDRVWSVVNSVPNNFAGDQSALVDNIISTLTFSGEQTVLAQNLEEESRTRNGKPRKSSRSKPSLGFNFDLDLGFLLPPLLTLLFIAFPAYLGAGSGYDNAEGKGSSSGAAMGTVLALFKGILLGGALFCFITFIQIAGAGSSSFGIGDKSGAALMLIFASVWIGGCVFIGAAILGYLGAMLGAIAGKKPGQRWAAIGASVGAWLYPVVTSLIQKESALRMHHW